jgi:hypothetical protein
MVGNNIIMDYQELYNVAMGFVMLLGGWFMRIIWDSLNKLQDADKDLAEKLGKIEVLVAGEYVKKDEFNVVMLRLFEKLDHIESKIDNKADK